MNISLSRAVGMVFRRDQLADLSQIVFLEIAPENWIGLGGRCQDTLREFTEKKPFTCHGLSLSIGSTDPLDLDLLNQVKQFINTHGITVYTEHLSWCSNSGH